MLKEALRRLPAPATEPGGVAKVEQVQLLSSDPRQSQTATDLCFHTSFQGAGDRPRQSQAMADSRRPAPVRFELTVAQLL